MKTGIIGAGRIGGNVATQAGPAAVTGAPVPRPARALTAVPRRPVSRRLKP